VSLSPSLHCRWRHASFGIEIICARVGAGGALQQVDPNQEGIESRARGSFRNTCSGCSIDDQEEWLSCTKCAKPCGAKIPASVNYRDCESKYFANNDGELRCEILPPGRYLASCENCQQMDIDDAQVLSCKCYSGLGHEVAANIRLDACSSGRFDNWNGNLVCEGQVPDLGAKAEL